MKDKYSFKEFLTNETYIGVDPETDEEIMGVISKIEIPMIQRDYAQGRVKEYKDGKTIINDTGSRFLKSIFKAVASDVEMELEFIYGSVEERPIPRSREKQYIYIPLDGQQRLTTLFLLYWYVGMRELPVNTPEWESHLSVLSKFTYLTRASSRIFCECICDSAKMKSIVLGETLPSLLIENCPWYYKEYKKDPTVKAMLAMLDHIAMLYSYENTYGQKFLSRLEKLKFYVFPLNKYKLTEDLYIKMNARGKQLSCYENFKADLINWMKSHANPEFEYFNQDVIYRERKMKYYMAFAQKMDNEWTDIFWKACHTSLEGDAVDNMFMRFFVRLFFNERILSLQRINELADEAIANDEVVKYFYGENGNDTNVTYSSNDFEDKYLKCLSFDVVKKIELFLDGIKEKLQIINETFVPSWQRSLKSKEDTFYSSKISWQGRIVFHATFMYFVHNTTFKAINYCDWIRIVWNFVVDPSIRNIKDNIGTLKFIDDLSNHSDSIIDWMAETSEGTRLKTQFIEEHIKAELVKKDPEWRNLLIEGEKHHLLKGRIMFLLHDKENSDKEIFKKHLAIARLIIPENKNNYLWMRAILAHIEEYDIANEALTLSDVRENWKTSLSDNLMIPMQKLLVNISSRVQDQVQTLDRSTVSQIMQEICESYKLKDNLKWIYPLVTWHIDDQTLLGSYSDSRKVEKRDSEVYLCYKTTLQSESCILLTGARDIIIGKILPFTDKEFEWIYTSYQCSIHNRFFRGMNVTLYRTVEIENLGPLKCSYVFTAKQIIVGARSVDNPQLGEEFSKMQWICSKVYDISDFSSLNDDVAINELVERIECEVFNLENVDSLLSLATRNVWQNDVKEDLDEENENNSKGMTIIFPNGKIVRNSSAIEAFKEALEIIGLEEVSKTNIKHSGYNLVDKKKRPIEHGKVWQHYYKGWFIYSNISNDAKKDDLIKLCPGIKVMNGVH